MIRNFKAFGLALGAMLVMGVVVAASASAQFEAETVPVKVTRSANNTQEYTYNEGITVKCTTVGGSGEQTVTPSTDFRFNPTYTGCTVPAIGGTAIVNLTGCGYTFTSAAKSTSMTTHIVCPEGKLIHITVYDVFGTDLCTLYVGPQTPAGTITGSNLGAGTTREVKIASSLSAITGTRSGSSLCGPEHSTTGTYKGEVTVTGENPTTNAHIGIFLD
ncbi:MAG TPA: hypothetical protein VFX35_09925 [Solirubrobacterales bacterium]|nr:hypothetical protein [Solirubrobacterales bacterium]